MTMRIPSIPERTAFSTLLLLLPCLLVGCGDAATEGAPGVDLDAQILRVGALNDESGPAASIGRPYAEGVRVAVARANAGELDFLPEGWRIELIERDHGYNPQQSVQAYNEIRDRVLFFALSFGTPNTLPLQPMLQRDNVVAFPASLSSEMAEHPYTPPAAPSYRVEAMRAMDWAVEQAEGPDAVRAGIVYQQDDYGQDGLNGWRDAAAHHGVEIVSEQAVAPGQSDMTAVISRLQSAGANYVLLTALPNSSAPVLGTAAQLGYRPVWIGQTPAWIDGFFSPDVVPPAVFENFYWVMGLPYWGEDVPGMDDFIDAFERFRRPNAPPDFYTLTGYLVTVGGLEAFRRALDADNPTREGFLQGLRSMEAWDAHGLLQPLDFSQFPYVTGTLTRILRPVMEERAWEVVADYAEPRSLGHAGR
ncbi:MAG: ABC transporter substrate-binding protein [Gemmatimonadota bacterium]